MVQSNVTRRNTLHDLGYKIFLDRYAQKDMTRQSLQVGDTVIVVVDSKTGQREVGKAKAINLPEVTVELLDGTEVVRDLEHVDKPIETEPEQMMARVAAGIAEVEPSKKLQKEWSEKFRWLLDDWKFVPGGRILTAAGTDQDLTFYNCMPPDQEVLTSEGYKPICDVRIGDLVVTHRNRLRRVLHRFERETEESIYVIKPRKLGYDDLRVTGEHKILVIRSDWVNAHRSRDGLRLKCEPAWIPAKDLRPGDYVAAAYNGEVREVDTIHVSDYVGIEDFESRPVEEAVTPYIVTDGQLVKNRVRADGTLITGKAPLSLHNELVVDEDFCLMVGRWLGDGCVTHRTGTDIPSGIKIVFGLDEYDEAEAIAAILENKLGMPSAIKLSSTERWYDLWVNSMPVGEFFRNFLGLYSHGKRIPDELMMLPDNLTLAMLRGLFQADGYVSGKYIGMLLANRELMAQVHQLLLRLGYFFSIKENTHKNGRKPAYRLTSTGSDCEALFQEFFATDAPERDHSNKTYLEYDGLKWVRINEIAVEDYSGVVLDLEVEEDHSFVSAGVVVSNCYVIASPKDSRDGIIETLGQMTEIMSRGGGVGINISTLRPRHAYVRGVNGRSSGSVSWGALYSFVTGLIEQGGCFGPDERIATDAGLIPTTELADRMDAGEVFHAHTHKGLRRITARFRNGVKPLYEVTTRRGFQVRITEDHKVGVLMDGKITTMPLKYLREGDEILLLLNDGEIIDEVTPHQVFGSNAATAPELLGVSQANVEPDIIESIMLIGDSEVYDFEVDDVHLICANGIYTSNSRRGALMLILNDWHPDVFDFINSKREMGNITNANISVGVSDKFMDAVKADGDWELVFPDTHDPDYDDLWDGDIDTWTAAGHKVIPYKTIKARELWDAIIESAWASAEPGVWFRERSNKMANSWYFNPLISTNPCVTGDTRIYTDQGLVQARELFDEETQIEAVIDGRFGFADSTTPASRVFMTGVKPVYKLTTKEGYTVRATADHRFMTPAGWTELQDLNPGDRLHILNRKGGFGQQGSLELGRVLGWLVGDGTIKADRAVLSFFGDEKRELAPVYSAYVTALAEPLTTRSRSYPVGVVDIADRDEARVQSARLRQIVEGYGLVENKLQVPEVVFKGTEDMQRGFLQALFTADGSVQHSKGMVSVRLASSRLQLLQQVQTLLSNFGIASKIYQNRRISQYRMMPDGKGGQKSYWTEAQHELQIAKQNLHEFAREINFLLDRKTNQLDDLLDGYSPRKETFLATVESIVADGVEEVFDLTVPDSHSFIGNGLVLHNCGEQPLGAYSVCNLGAINLSRFYDAEKHDVDWDNLGQTVAYATRFLDNVIDTTPYFFEENEKVQGSERRVGLGTMGIAELMIRMGVRYGSEESVEFIDKVYGFITETAYRTSTEIAAEKGPFPMFDAEKFLESGFMQTLSEDIREAVRENGIRNVTLLTQAPTGTTGTMVNTSTGIEPFFSWVYYRKSRLGLHEENVPIAQEWKDAHPDQDELPDYFVTAMDLSPGAHVRVQGAFQRWIDSAISKTCNVPNDYTVEQTGELYEYMYELGCKGGTVYRDGSRSEQVLMLKDEEDETKEEKQSAAEVAQVATPHRVYPRPAKLQGVTVNCATPFGTAYVTMNSDQHGYPFEVFITAPGKAGSDLQADAEGLGRMISLSLRTTDPHNRVEMLRLIIDQLRDIGGSRSVGLGERRVTSLPDSVARALEEQYFPPMSAQQLGLPLDDEPGPKPASVQNLDANSAPPVHGVINGADMCPSCGTIALVRAEGCRKCLACGYSEC